MTYDDGTDGTGTDVATFTTDGDAARIVADLATAQKAATITFTVTPGALA